MSYSLKFNYPLTSADSARIPCDIHRDRPATRSMNDGAAPFHYPCDECATQFYRTGHFYAYLPKPPASMVLGEVQTLTVSPAQILRAASAKSPIIGVQIEGQEPLAVDRKRLVAWSKGVKISRVFVEVQPDTVVYSYDRPKLYVGTMADRANIQGPEERTERVIAGARSLCIIGNESAITPGKFLSSCKITALPRKVTRQELRKWAEKEFVRLADRKAASLVSAKDRKAAKIAAHEMAGDGLAEYTVQSHDGKISVRGSMVTLAALPGYNFILHKHINRDGVYTVSEPFTGFGIGSGKSPEKALVEANRTWFDSSEEKRALALGKIELARIAAAA